MTDILTPISPGELIDKLTILRLKSEKITDKGKLANVRVEMAALSDVAEAALPKDTRLDALWKALYDINADLWKIEDEIRECEAASDFGDTFIALARAVYITNDKRAEVKKQINLLLGSRLVEEKSYADHGVKL